ncbi:hypothetical protein D7S86_27465 [Pararobbsia silviterrae]|uniref:Uncharacterized protein n=1 Tax=Pararobbsia silviterrae TaxID=1792498 RepID=A0A494X337_9BURK|nr:hypothetical protein D7S86_27465 [Pararobbsia silviterrae]
MGSVLAYLDGQPVREGDILFGLTGARLRACVPWRRDQPLRMEVLEKMPGDPDFWATGTHWKGQQVLFWRKEDVPEPKELNQYLQLKAQLDARKPRKRPVSARRR